MSSLLGPARSLVSLAPIYVSLAFIAMFLAAMYVIADANLRWLTFIAVALPNGFVVAWSHALRSTLSAGAPSTGIIWRSALFVVVIGICFLTVRPFLLPNLPAIELPVLALLVGVIVIGYTSYLWGTASALVRWENSGYAKVVDVFRAFVLIFYLPLGIWLLARRIKSVRT